MKEIILMFLIGIIGSIPLNLYSCDKLWYKSCTKGFKRDKTIEQKRCFMLGVYLLPILSLLSVVTFSCFSIESLVWIAIYNGERY